MLAPSRWERCRIEPKITASAASSRIGIVVSPEYERYPQLGSLAGLLGMDVSAGPQLGAGVTRSALLDLFLAHVLR
jgi:hypothetical protein